jgi:serine/threonine-protein kinase
MDAVASPLNPGDVLAGRYRVERILGEGGMGVVLAAEHLVLGERVAIKMLLPAAAKMEGAVARFQREARAAARIQSEHVARVMDVGVTDQGTPYLVMEYVEGRDLSDELEARGPLPIEEAVNYVMQGAVGVAEAHANHIVHRDLKPSNLFLAKLPNGRSFVKVLDFGIAKEAGVLENKELTTTFSALGSPAYMSPEQLRAAKSVDERTDVWAFGVVLYELLSGRLPFDGDSLTAIAAAISVDPPAPLRTVRPEVPAELEAVILACLEKDREARVPSLAVLARMLAPFGGKSAATLAGRIQASLGVSQPPPPESQVASSKAAQVAPARPELQATRPAWTKTGGASEGANVKIIALAALFGLVLVSVAVLILRHAGGDDHASSTQASGASSSSVTPQPVALAAPAPSLTATATATATATSAPAAAEPLNALSVTPTARVREPPIAAPKAKPSVVPPPRPAPKSGGKIRKPLVTDL